ncbi:MAG: hypothetical protein HXX08_20985 [Chloroflexi bacterium]|uniref:AN1-type domain-containing protein n=1 Tax=Candidatus Chlorohelix allophototropha TaxID=3003348 RepID=A0A8T7M8A1_9CHLR|nr:hypothetical protein [Chloroflexota bacterium]WJW68273.1 hypothetical protein OZ401_003880 [Chloroflexota bacterium L227-S17]
MALACEKGFFCKTEVIEQCSYCGKHFCIRHGHRDKAVCKSPSCMRKYRHELAVVERFAYEDEKRALGFARNYARLCGKENCNHEFYLVCGRCEVQFCPTHISRHIFHFDIITIRGTTRVRDEINLCELCKPYLSDYKKDRYE